MLLVSVLLVRVPGLYGFLGFKVDVLPLAGSLQCNVGSPRFMKQLLFW